MSFRLRGVNLFYTSPRWIRSILGGSEVPSLCPHAALCRETLIMLARWNRVAVAVVFLNLAAVCGAIALQADDKTTTEKKGESKPKLKEVKLFNGQTRIGQVLLRKVSQLKHHLK